MKTQIWTSTLGAALVALAIPAAAQNADSHNNSAVKSSHTVNAGSPRRGANSFTENQARNHISKAGFTQVSRLNKDKNGVWKGTAMKGNQRIAVAMDFKGNVSIGK